MRSRYNFVAVLSAVVLICCGALDFSTRTLAPLEKAKSQAQ